jgi:hypothetical protein
VRVGAEAKKEAGRVCPKGEANRPSKFLSEQKRRRRGACDFIRLPRVSRPKVKLEEVASAEEEGATADVRQTEVEERFRR